MILAVALALQAQFPSAPDPVQFEIGQQVAARKPKLGSATLFRAQEPRVSIDRIGLDDEKSIGSWSNGLLQQTTETCTWLSPALMSRWVGFLAKREKLSPDQVSAKWATIRETLNGNITFVVRLSAFPKLPTFNIGDEEPANLADIDDVRFVVTVDGDPREVKAYPLARWRSRDRKSLNDYRWWLDTPLKATLNPEFEPTENRYQLPLGPYHAAWYLVTAPTPDSDFNHISVHVLSQRKERRAEWKAASARRQKKT